MIDGYEIELATPDDIPGILMLQEPNLHQNDGGLSARQTGEWFKRTMLEMPIVVCRCNSNVVGYAVATSLDAKSHVAIIQTMLRTFPAPPNCYLYGPVCVAPAERGQGLAGDLYEDLRSRLPGRTAMTFVRSDNAPSLRAHRKMGMKELGEFTNDGASYIAFTYSG